MSGASLRRDADLRPGPGPCPVIVTDRLHMRPYRLTDADAIAESLSDFQVTRMLTRVPAPYHRQDALDWLVPRVSGALPDWGFAITTTRDDAPVGGLSIELRHGRWHLGYWLNRFYWGRGYMSEAAAGAIERFSRRMPESALHSGAFADNPASLRIQEKLGFRITGCSDMYSSARNAMATHLETVLEPQGLRAQRAA
ncbi:GNAT family N-acetyltransferase [Rhizobiaceae bacterium n13]|uniref:GNAT family N-acetyltransferase n=1 Tax=Ferirhizobium litorale TaxID=2927786 RepID=A0AAE3QDY6_9HYPH|nr:GNAT family N-acetyltransferase [Fererhizobium litorale]MDI7863102.1 GNAT family N-acetyltransferase [Fererhizobium litorale]MDI7923221.1 GNAT family N-acetyltransferase [Fererhizobium litorale]